jgi:hypothetical protein
MPGWHLLKKMGKKNVMEEKKERKGFKRTYSFMREENDSSYDLDPDYKRDVLMKKYDNPMKDDFKKKPKKIQKKIEFNLDDWNVDEY